MLAWMLLLTLQGVSPLRVLEKGDQSYVEETRRVAVRTAAEWGLVNRVVPSGDLEASPEFRLHLVRVLTDQVFAA